MTGVEVDLFEQALQNESKAVTSITDTSETVETTEASETTKITETADNTDNVEQEVKEINAESGISSPETTAHSSSDFTSSDDDDDGDDDGDDLVPVIEEADDEEPAATGPIRSVHELVEEPVPVVPEDFIIDEKATINEIGTIKSAFEHNIIITASLSGEQRVLKEGSILCLQEKTLVGPVCEVFGPLQAPFYRVSFDKDKEISSTRFNDLKTKVGAKIFYVTPEARWVDTFELKQIKGTDASNGFDEELPENEQEFSDDEKEMEFKRKKKLAKKRKNNDDDSENTAGGKTAFKNKDPLPYSNKSTVSYRSRNIRENRSQYRDTEDGSSEGQISCKRPKNERPHSKSIVPTNPMQFPPGFPHMYNPQFSQPMAYGNQQPPYNNGGFYQPQYPSYPNQPLAQQQGIFQYQQQFQQPFASQPQMFPPQSNIPLPNMPLQFFPPNTTPVSQPMNTFPNFQQSGQSAAQQQYTPSRPLNDPHERSMNNN